MTPHAFFASRIFAVPASILVSLLILIGFGMAAVLVISLMIVLPFLAVTNAILYSITGVNLAEKYKMKSGNEPSSNTSFGCGQTKG